jgi:hypothetical protein
VQFLARILILHPIVDVQNLRFVVRDERFTLAVAFDYLRKIAPPDFNILLVTS